MGKRMRTNKIRCKHCDDIIESFDRHDFKWCKCKKVAIDGGISYGKRLFPDHPMEDHIEDLSEYEEV
ncbi:hypothetical protein PQE74_gp046 [Bacillus phage vB_BanS_Chewbecca]|uniref:DUF7695 domain-containing protein n=2 Tax=Tsamsavirus TaxID=3044849 RepID=A0AAE9CC36_9CAUD|nr:hypothetical protein PQE73_gp053 [Bacillus phage vB_BanS_MrDarsey]YP_010681189.1 hypothetical protein PQE74_gp046 [Bacillus phage vB_BanS_Chewbecca]UGO46129.1 hypothetical protein CHEWBECCA_46 [Bacillus phage vB_BanS_Chewbecca]UGO47885.1 hypothetical protein MRDARSEY_53 [Bacillus phage vB_BanS_MrDarsey]